MAAADVIIDDMAPDGMAELEEVFRRLFDRAYRVAYRILGDPQESEDAAAEAFARAHANWAKVGRLPYVDAWILRVTSNVAIDIARRRAKVIIDDMNDRIELVAADAAPDGTNAAIDRVVLVAALARLPRRQREVLVLRFLGELRESDVAACLGCSVGTVKTHTHRGLANLRRVFTPAMLRAAGWT